MLQVNIQARFTSIQFLVLFQLQAFHCFPYYALLYNNSRNHPYYNTTLSSTWPVVAVQRPSVLHCISLYWRICPNPENRLEIRLQITVGFSQRI